MHEGKKVFHITEFALITWLKGQDLETGLQLREIGKYTITKYIVDRMKFEGAFCPVTMLALLVMASLTQ